MHFKRLAFILCLFVYTFNVLAADKLYSAGMSTIEFKDGDRHMVMSIFYPADAPKADIKPVVIPLMKGLDFYENAKIAFNGKPFPLIMFSHGKGGDRFTLAWLAQFLATHGYIVASVDHAEAVSYLMTYEFAESKLWQRPQDLSSYLTYLLKDKEWSKYIDASKIGAAGHSQGGFTVLWVGGAKVNPAIYKAYQHAVADNAVIPGYYKEKLLASPESKLLAHDSRIKAIFAMAPARLKTIGMDEDGLKKITIPTYLIAGGNDTNSPAPENAEYASKYISRAKFTLLEGNVGHEIFVNECNDAAKIKFADACSDAPGVDRAKLHAYIANEALSFFNAAL